MSLIKLNLRKNLLVLASICAVSFSWMALRRQPSSNDAQRQSVADAEPQALRDAPAPKADFDDANGGGSSASLLQQVQESAPPPVQIVPTDASGSNAVQASKDTRTTVSQNLISDILNLRENQPIPAAAFAQYDANAIAESLVERLYRREAASGAAAPPKGDMVDMWADTELHHFASSKEFFPFVREGFKNQFQMETSGGSHNLTMRNTGEQALLGIKLTKDFHDAKTNRLRPKFGVVFFPHLETANAYLASAYGDIIVIFKDQLKLRSTWTTNSSFGTSDNGNTFWMKGALSELSNVPFCEFQTWGEIRIEDVQAIGVIPDTPQDFRDRIIAAGFRVIEFKTPHPYDSDTFYKFARTLSQGNPRTLAQWIQNVRTGKIRE